jgi:acid phosphatase (class A)
VDDFEVITAENGLVGLEKLREHQEILSLVLLDVYMPQCDGFEFLRRRAEDEALANVPVIVTTASDSLDDEIRCLQLGANDFVVKPYNADIIMNRINNTIHLRETASIVNQLTWDDLTKLFGQYAHAFGLTIDPIATPEIYKLLSTSLATTDPMRKKTKAHYGRQRPFERFGDAMPSHEEESLRGEGSYPSGHSLRGWGTALLLAQIAPERANEIFKRGWDFCTSRVIVGAHWQSDVDASRTAASIGFCALQGSEEFIAQMKKAQQEYKVKTGQTTGISQTATAPAAAQQARIYTINGTPATKSTHGIVVQNGKKTIWN